MEEIIIKDVKEKNIIDLCHICIPPVKRADPDWIVGAEEKKAWAIDMLKKWHSFAKLAYIDEIPAGMIQYKPIPNERVVNINCIYVPWDKYWRKGAATKLLNSLIEDVKKPLVWFNNKQALALVTKTFPGEAPGQLAARLFFTKRDFKQIDKDPDFLYYPLKKGFAYKPIEKEKPTYIPQKEDKGKVLIICGPNSCSAAYAYFLKRIEKYLREISPEIPILWIDTSKEAEEAKKRNVGYGDCIVNAKLIKSFVLDKKNFQEEIREALRN